MEPRRKGDRPIGMKTSTGTRGSIARGLAISALLALSAAGCAAGGATPASPAAPTDEPAETATSPAGGADLTPVPDVTVKPGITRVPVLPGSGDPGEGVPPDVIQAAVDDAAARAGVDPTTVTVVSTQSMTWPNGALGCPVRGFMYTDAVTPGYRVVVEAGGQRYDYRATQQGDVRWCEDPPGPG